MAAAPCMWPAAFARKVDVVDIEIHLCLRPPDASKHGTREGAGRKPKNRTTLTYNGARARKTARSLATCAGAGTPSIARQLPPERGPRSVALLFGSRR